MKPDILLRQPDLKKGEEDNKNIILLKPEHFLQQVFNLESLDSNFLTGIKASKRARDRFVKRALAKRRNSGKNMSGESSPGKKGSTSQETSVFERILSKNITIVSPLDIQIIQDTRTDHLEPLVALHPVRHQEVC